MTRLHNTEHFDLHDDDGSHRSTCSTADGLKVAQHEANLTRHLYQHEEIQAERSTRHRRGEKGAGDVRLSQD